MIAVRSVATVVSILAMVALLIFVMAFVLLFGMLFPFFSMLFTLICLPVVVILPPVRMVLMCPSGVMVIPPILVVPLVVPFVESSVAILPGGWLMQRLPILRMVVRPSLKMGMLRPPVRVVDEARIGLQFCRSLRMVGEVLIPCSLVRKITVLGVRWDDSEKQAEYRHEQRAYKTFH